MAKAKTKKKATRAARPKPSLNNVKFTYLVECEAHGSGGSLSFDCSCPDYCRCYRISDVTIESVSVSGVMDAVCKEFRLTTGNHLGRYGVFRVLSAHGVFDCSNYEGLWGAGYYGEEVQGGRFTGRVADIDAALNRFLGLRTLKAKVEHLLVLEYGHLLESLKDRKWREALVEKGSLVLGNTDHYHKLDRNAVERYADWDLLHAVCVKDGDRYRVIDGYHRSAALLQSTNSKARIIYAT